MVFGMFFYVLLGFLVVLFELRVLVGIFGFFFGVYIIRIFLKNFDGLNGDCFGVIVEIMCVGIFVVMVLVWWYL